MGNSDYFLVKENFMLSLKLEKWGSFLCTKSIFFFEISLLGLSELHLMAVTVRWLKMIVYIFKENSWFAQSGGKWSILGTKNIKDFRNFSSQIFPKLFVMTDIGKKSKGFFLFFRISLIISKLQHFGLFGGAKFTWFIFLVSSLFMW